MIVFSLVPTLLKRSACTLAWASTGASWVLCASAHAQPGNVQTEAASDDGSHPSAASSAGASTQSSPAAGAGPLPAPADAPTANGQPGEPAPATAVEPPLPPPYPTAPAAPPPDAASPQSDEVLPLDEQEIYEPPLPDAYARRGVDSDAVSVPAPPAPRHVAPRSAFWVGARPGLFVPLGSAWIDGEPVGDLCCVEASRPWSEFAGTGPSLGVDAGVRFGRHYQAFAFYEHAWLSSGALEDAFGGQEGASTSVFGGGFRFSTHPDAVGMIVEISLGYRTFEANWASGTRLTAADDLFSTRLGFGVEWRINHLTNLELMLMVGGGSLTDVRWRFADGSKGEALTDYDRYGQYIPFGIQLASHWDVIASDD